jgi:spore maturation protein CgeB
MKILFVAPTSDNTQQAHDAIVSLGHEVVWLDDRRDYALPVFLRRHRTLWRIGRRWRWWRRRSNTALQQRVLVEAERFHPRALVALKGMNIKPATLSALQSRGIRTAVWCVDNAANEPYASWVRMVGPQWDRFFSFDSAIGTQMPESARPQVLPMAVNPERYSMGALSDADRARYACEVVFIGAPYPDRVALLARIADSVNLKIWGWKGWNDTSLAKFYHGPLDARESAKAYRCAAVSVNTNILPRARGVNGKTYEICASGGFQLSDECADLRNQFAVGAELAVFKDADDFVEQVKYWLARPQERARIAEAGRARVLRDHTLRQRMETLISSL